MFLVPLPRSNHLIATRQWLHIRGLGNCVQYSLDDRLLLPLVKICVMPPVTIPLWPVTATITI